MSIKKQFDFIKKSRNDIEKIEKEISEIVFDLTGENIFYKGREAKIREVNVVHDLITVYFKKTEDMANAFEVISFDEFLQHTETESQNKHLNIQVG